MLPGDVALSNCGVAARRWNRLANEIGAVVHCAADVNLLKSYEMLRAANVQGTFELLKFCLEGAAKHFIYASTLSVFVATDRCQGKLCESDDHCDTSAVFGGYAQSKWAAEALVREARFPADRLSVFRFGLLGMDSRTGLASERDLLTSAIRGLCQLGCISDCLPELCFDLTPVDFAAEAMVHLAFSLRVTSAPRIYHIANPPSVSLRRLTACLRSVQPNLATVPHQEFCRRIAAVAEEAHPLGWLGLRRWISGDQSPTFDRAVNLFQATGVEFDMANTVNGLKNCDIVCPPADDRLLTQLIRRILKT